MCIGSDAEYQVAVHQFFDEFPDLTAGSPDDAVCIYLQVHTHIVQFFRKLYIFGDAVIALDVRQYDFVSCELQLLDPLSDVAVCLLGREFYQYILSAVHRKDLSFF